jgi:pyruvate dehydrogenase E2 component (dihydrolipoamide acetyltransferase)
MPRLGQTMTEGVITRWLRQAGDRVSKGEPVAEIETDKAILELESPADGVVLELLAGEGEAVPVGEAVALVSEEGA